MNTHRWRLRLQMIRQDDTVECSRDLGYIEVSPDMALSVDMTTTPQEAVADALAQLADDLREHAVAEK